MLIRVAGLVVVGFLVPGCSIAGTWQTVAVEPAGAGAGPFQMATFTDDGQYSASIASGLELRTTIGRYTWDGFKLTLTPNEGEEQVYPGRYDAFTEQLILTHESEAGKTTARLEKKADLPK